MSYLCGRFSNYRDMTKDNRYTLTTRRPVYAGAKTLLPLWVVLILMGCGVSEDNHQKETDGFSIAGTWELNHLLFLSGQRVDVHTGYEYVWYRFFEDDGMYYVAELNDNDSLKPVKPHEMSEYFFMMSPYDTVYIEHGRMTSLNIVDNRTIGIDRGDYVEVYEKSDRLSAKNVSEIEKTVEKALRPNSNGRTQYIVPTPSGADDTYYVVWINVLVIVVSACFLYIYKKVKAGRQQPEATKDVETGVDGNQQNHTFIHSDYYLSLRQRLYEGPTLKQDEWEELERQMKGADAMFFRRLADMGQLSEVEQRVCMLIRLGIPPSAIAMHTCREQSSISSIRSRLYYKLFGKKGGARELDEFILSI